MISNLNLHKLEERKEKDNKINNIMFKKISYILNIYSDGSIN